MAAQYESLQFVVFTAGGDVVDILGLWAKVIGGTPLAFQPIPPIGKQCVGRHREASLVLQGQPGRVDLIFAPQEQNALSPGINPSIGDVREHIEYGVEVAGQIAQIVDLHRLAVVIQASTSVRDNAEAIETIRKKAPDCDIPGNASDVSFQLNIPTSSSVSPGMEISRLCRWSTGKRFIFHFDAITGQSKNLPGMTVAGEYADVFTPIDRSVTKEDAPKLLEELASIAMSIIEGGYSALA